MRGQHFLRSIALTAVILTAACTNMPKEAPPPTQPSRPVTPTPKPPSAESIALRSYYARVERDLVGQGLLRTDGGGNDTPITARMLADNFVRIALFDEYANQNGRFVARASASRLRRWEGPIRMGVIFGENTPPNKRNIDQRQIADYTARLSRLTNVPIRLTNANTNFDVLFLNEDERRASAPLLQQLVPGISKSAINTIVELPKSTFCLVFAFSEGTSDVYTRALAVVRTEHPDRLRQSCIHEELAQAMGLANDSPDARPSVFNDDEEFGLLTRHDEILLRILYDPRLKSGMTTSDARPIVETIAHEMIGGES